tara:strand:+ start:2454 stop:2702 length:249 start_codon:yes stop_codon:yes gene_type:complete
MNKSINSALERACGQLQAAGEREREISPIIGQLGTDARQRILNGESTEIVNRDYLHAVSAARQEWNEERAAEIRFRNSTWKA